MSFFKDFKEDLSQAVNELLPGEELQGSTAQKQPDLVVNTLEQEVDVESELKKLEGLFEKVEEPAQTAKPVVLTPEQPELPEIKLEDAIQKSTNVNTDPEGTKQKEETIVSTENEVNVEKEISTLPQEVSDEVTVITEGTSLRGDMESTGSFEMRGKVEGNITCNGKMTVTGKIKGNTKSAEFFADSAKIEGEITTTGTVKVGLGSVVVGNISASSAVIAGAIKGDIDVQGPVVVDTSAVVMGNIKSRSVQINNGAVIEGFCSQCYAEVDMDSLFEDNKKG
ncbi:MAG: polymer-forming cytoskeletal protein [Lachnospiraceae bacterium]|nr:polymer-forming cytoskeletal protein [Lachnospiraceae bacterium]